MVKTGNPPLPKTVISGISASSLPVDPETSQNHKLAHRLGGQFRRAIPARKLTQAKYPLQIILVAFPILNQLGQKQSDLNLLRLQNLP